MDQIGQSLPFNMVVNIFHQVWSHVGIDHCANGLFQINIGDIFPKSFLGPLTSGRVSDASHSEDIIFLQ